MKKKQGATMYFKQISTKWKWKRHIHGSIVPKNIVKDVQIFFKKNETILESLFKHVLIYDIIQQAVVHKLYKHNVAPFFLKQKDKTHGATDNGEMT